MLYYDVKNGLTYQDILNDPSIQELYKNADMDERRAHAHHGIVHVQNTIDIANKLFKVVDLPDDIKQASLIALALHDIGKTNENSSQPYLHEIDSCAIATEYLENAQVPHKKAIIDAIRNHFDPTVNKDIVGAVVCMCDKMDFNYKRLTEQGRQQGNKVEGELGDISFALDGNTFKVSHTCTDKFGRFMEHPFIPMSMGASIKGFADQIGKNAEWSVGENNMKQYVENDFHCAKKIQPDEVTQEFLALGIKTHQTEKPYILEFENLSDINKEYIRSGQANTYLHIDHPNKRKEMRQTDTMFSKNGKWYLDIRKWQGVPPNFTFQRLNEQDHKTDRYNDMKELADNIESRKQDIENEVLKIFDSIAATGKKDTKQVLDELAGGENEVTTIEAAHSAFGVDEEHPQVLDTNADFAQAEGELFFHGTQDIDGAINYFQKGGLHYTKHAKEGTGFYVGTQDSFGVAANYARENMAPDLRLDKIMVGRLAPGTKKIDTKCLGHIRNLVLPSAHSHDTDKPLSFATAKTREEKLQIVSTILQHGRTKGANEPLMSAFALACGFDVLKFKLDRPEFERHGENANCYTIMRRKNVIQAPEPIATNFQTTIEQETGRDLKKGYGLM